MEPETIVILITIVGSVLGSTLTTIGLLLNQMGKFEGWLSVRIDRLENRVDRLEDKLDATGRDVTDIRERMARVEGHLMAPEGFTLRHTRPAVADQPPPEDPAPDRRQAG